MEDRVGVMDFKAAVKDWLPPVLLRQLRKARKVVSKRRPPRPVDPPEWEYIPQGWNVNQGAVRGWNQQGVAETYAGRWHHFQKLIAGPGPLGINYEGLGGLDDDNLDAHNHVMTLAYVVGRLIHRRDSLTILDYGGALGHYLAFLRVLFPAFPFDYSCCELPYVAAQGRQLHPQVKYITDDSWMDQRFDLVFASNSIHYARQWQERLAQLAAAAKTFLLITRLPVVQKVPSFVVLQRVERYGYQTEYLGWCLNQADFLAAAGAIHLILEREFLMGVCEPDVINAPERLHHKGFLFRRADGE